ncbi:MAG: TetR family transcriptional regulator [Nakamurella sp.]
MNPRISATAEVTGATSVAAPRRDSTPLSRAAMIGHALQVADTDGLAAVSIRRIAQDFGVTPMALYWHVKNKDELLAAMGDAIIDEVPVPSTGRTSELEDLRPLLLSLVDALRRHPGSTSLAMNRILQCDNGRVLSELALKILRDNGFAVQQSADLARSALQTAIMLVSGRPGAETTVPQEERAAVLEHKRAVLVGLPADRFPLLVESAEALTECADEAAYYGAGIDLFMAGVSTLRKRQ